MSGQRQATHAGSWYEANSGTLATQLRSWLQEVPKSLEPLGSIPPSGARVIIGPHAGYSYSGHCASYAYASLDLSNCNRIFLLGPSHHYGLSNAALSSFESYSTPLGPLPIDTDVIAALRAAHPRQFSMMTPLIDEAEHSLEMHIPYIRHVLVQREPDAAEKPDLLPKLIPIMVGSTSKTAERAIGKALAPYLKDPRSVFIISSDFCHWGHRFAYTYYINKINESGVPDFGNPDMEPKHLGRKSPESPKIHQSISAVDKLCWQAIETGKVEEFWEVLEKTGNTVCGRHPIAVMMCAMEEVEGQGGPCGRFKFVRYEKSDEIQSVGTSSVSYCAAVAVMQ